MIAIVDYETSHAAEVRAAFESVGVTATIAGAIEQLDRASKIVLPPTATFSRAVRSIRDRGLVPPLMRAVDQGRPILGIGHGLHLLFDVSYEEGQHTGLGVIPGKVTRFDFGDHPVRLSVPTSHQGFSSVHWSQPCTLFNGITSGSSFYFDHRFYADPLDPRIISAIAHHGIDFSAAVVQGSIAGLQFLPHLSEEAGRQILRNFAKM